MGKNVDNYFVNIPEPCSFSCIFCAGGGNGSGTAISSVKKKPNDDVFRGIIKEILLAKKNGAKSLEIGGGEPIDHPKISEVIKEAKKYYSKISIHAASTKLADENFLKEIAKNGITAIKLPLYGVSAKTHDSIVGHPGSFDAMIKALNILRGMKVKVSVSTIILRQNINEVPGIIGFVKRQYPKLDDLGFFAVLPKSTSQLNYLQLMPRYSEVGKILRLIFDTAKKHHVGISFFNFPFCIIKTLPGDLPINGFPIVCGNDDHPGWTRLYSDKCRECSLSSECLGIPKEYFDYWGDEGLNKM